jgi:hypothetical protein
MLAFEPGSLVKQRTVQIPSITGSPALFTPD